MSNKGKEYESRLMLTEEEYLRLVSCFLKLYPNAHFLQNANTYFDTEELSLKEKHITLRTRIINDARSELTLKIKGDDGDLEINDCPSKKEIDLLFKENVFPDGEVKKYLINLPYHLYDYHPLVTLYNRRLEIQYPDYLLVIDKNTYVNTIDYNIEIESNIGINHAKQILKEYIERYQLTLVNQPYVGKVHRALNALKNSN